MAKIKIFKYCLILGFITCLILWFFNQEKPLSKEAFHEEFGMCCLYEYDSLNYRYFDDLYPEVSYDTTGTQLIIKFWLNKNQDLQVFADEFDLNYTKNYGYFISKEFIPIKHRSSGDTAKLLFEFSEIENQNENYIIVGIAIHFENSNFQYDSIFSYSTGIANNPSNIR